MAIQVDMSTIIKDKDRDLESLNYLIDRIGAERLPVKILLNDEDPSAVLYTNKKKELFEKYGFKCILTNDPLDLPWNSNEFTSIVQLPIENAEEVISRIGRNVDIDCLTADNIFKIFRNRKYTFLPATVSAIDFIADHYLNSDLRGARVLIVGKSPIVGKPLALHWMNRGATVTICGSQEACIRDLLNSKDIIVLATPVPHLISTKDFVTGTLTLVIDAGICKDSNGKVVGNFKDDFDSGSTVLKEEQDIWYTPVPGGVGPLTVRCLVENHMIACIKNAYSY